MQLDRPRRSVAPLSGFPSAFSLVRWSFYKTPCPGWLPWPHPALTSTSLAEETDGSLSTCAKAKGSTQIYQVQSAALFSLRQPLGAG